MKHTKSCDTCGKSFTKDSLLAAQSALNLHVTRKHNYRKLPNRFKPDKPKRKYTRRQPSAPLVRYCPGCGCDITALSIALSTIKGMK